MSEAIRVLHVDDEPDFAETTARVLERENDELTVETATSPTDALELIDQQEFDCVIADYAMPEHNGIDLLNRLRDEFPDLPVIIYTGKGSEKVASAAISAGVTDYLPKDASEDIYQLLADRVTEAIEHHRARVNYEQIFEKIPDGIVIHEIESFEFVDMNQKYVDMFGYDNQEEFLDAGFESIHIDEPPYTLENAKQHVQQALEEGPQTFEWPGVRKDGSQFWSEVHLTPIRLHGQEQILAAVRDVTERHEYERELERSNERLDEFASIVSHDLRNPLSVAEGRLEMAKEKYDDENLDAIDQAHQRIRTLIEDLLTLTREDAAIDTRNLDLAEIAEISWENVSTGDSELRVRNTRELLADQSRVQQLLENLFRNAIEHTRDEVTVFVDKLEDGFYVADDGAGIPPEIRDEIFRLGYTTSQDGTGYGLNIVKEIADDHGWDVYVTDSEFGGACFEITGVERPT